MNKNLEHVLCRYFSCKIICFIMKQMGQTDDQAVVLIVLGCSIIYMSCLVLK